MLKTRVITALVILPIILIALFLFPDWAWGVFTFGIAIVACWEWSRLCQLSTSGSRIYLALSLVLSVFLLFLHQRGQVAGISFSALAFCVFSAAALFWLLAVPVWLIRLWRPAHRAPLAIAGWIVIFPTWMALLYLRAVSPWLLLTFAAIIWVADIAAYFVGRQFGRHKLAIAISPGKTIEGALGGIVGVVGYFFLWQLLLDGSFVGRQVWTHELRSNIGALFAFFVLLALLSVTGDLFESWMKRGAAMKDSSSLLPGHGGVLDRIDALTSTLPLAGLYVLLLAGG